MEEARNEAVVTFLAILEMAKLGLLKVSQLEDEDEIYIARAVNDLRERLAVAKPSLESDQYA